MGEKRESNGGQDENDFYEWTLQPGIVADGRAYVPKLATPCLDFSETHIWELSCTVVSPNDNFFDILHWNA